MTVIVLYSDGEHATYTKVKDYDYLSAGPALCLIFLNGTCQIISLHGHVTVVIQH